jgi:hypothetical protein
MRYKNSHSRNTLYHKRLQGIRRTLRYKIPSSCNRLCWLALSRTSLACRYKRTSR